MTPVRELGSHLQFASWRVPQFPRAIEYPLEVMEEIRAFACDELLQLSHGGDEVGGILFGTRRDDLLRIVTWRPIACEHNQGAGLKLSHSDRMNLAVQLEMARQNADLKDLRPLGWFVSHLRDGVSLSPSDLEIYNGFFPESSQIALVINPQGGGRAEAGFFFREAEDKLRSEASYRVFELQPLHMAASAAADTAAPRPAESESQVVAKVQPVRAQVETPVESVAQSVAVEPVQETAPEPTPEPVTEVAIPEITNSEPPVLPPEPLAPQSVKFEPPVDEPAPPQPASLTPPEPAQVPQEPIPPVPRPPLHGHRFESILGAENEPAAPRRFESILAPNQAQTPPRRFESLFGPTPEPARSSEPVPPHIFPPLAPHNFETVTTPVFETEAPIPTRERWLWAIPILLALGIAGFILYQHRPASEGSVSLRASTDAQTVQLRWDANSKAIRDADHAEMTISDGGKSSQLSLTADQLHAGKMSYLPQSGDIGFAMTIFPANGDALHDYTRLVAPGLHPPAQPVEATQPPAQAAPTALPAGDAPQTPPATAAAEQPPQPELVAEVQRLKDDLARERARADELQNVVRILENRLGIKSTPPAKTYRRR